MKHFAIGRFLSGVLMSCAFGAASAQDFPSKPVRLIVPYPGGVPDFVARTVAPMATPALGQQVVVENVSGAGGLLAIQRLLQSPADGYTVVLADAAQWAIVPAMRPGVYDPVNDLVPVVLLATSTLYIAVTDKVPAKTIQEFVALAKARPGTLSYASAGTGTLHHLFMESFKAASGIEVLHVPFKGMSQALTAFLGGEPPIGIGGWLHFQPHTKDGKVRVLASSTKDRSRLTPEVPSMRDFGAPEIDFSGDMGLVAPARTPRAVIDRLAGAFGKAAQSPEFATRMSTQGLEVLYRSPDQFGEVIKSQGQRFARAMKVAGIKPEGQ